MATLYGNFSMLTGRNNPSGLHLISSPVVGELNSLRMVVHSLSHGLVRVWCSEMFKYIIAKCEVMYTAQRNGAQAEQKNEYHLKLNAETDCSSVCTHT